MGKYATKMQRTASLTLSVGNITAPAASMRRIKIYDLTFGSEGAPVDAAFLWTGQRCSTTGTRTTVSHLGPLDPAEAACVATVGENHTVEPTYTANTIMLDEPINQKATYRWVAIPGGEIVIPATANAGVGFFTPVATNLASVTARAHFEEQ